MIGVIVRKWMVMALGLEEQRVTVAVETHHEVSQWERRTLMLNCYQ